MRIVILDSFAADQGDDTMWTGLRALGELVVYARSTDADVVARCAGAAAALTNKVAFSANDFAALPDLRYVGVLATGTNIVDAGAARAAGVAVTNVPSYAAASVAQHVLALILHFSQDVAGHAAAVKTGAWAASPDFCFFTKEMFELDGKTLVLVGSGAIGGAVARIGEAFGMRVVRAAVPGSPTRRRRVAHAPRRGVARRRRRVAALPADGGDARHGRRAVPGGDEAGRDPDQHRARRADRRGGAGGGAREPAGWAASDWTCSRSSRRPPITR